MPSATVACPYCETDNTVTVPDGVDIKKVVKSYRTGIRGDENISSAECAGGHHFAVKYR